MKVATKAYGLIEVDERHKITFPRGLFGFESCKEYALLDAERQPFYWLQSMDVEGVAFIVIDPCIFRPDYEVTIDNEELQELDLPALEAALIFSIITIPADRGPMTANLQGPLIINRNTRFGKQLVLSDPRWKTKHDVMAELAAGRHTPC
ncbi:MAG: flagellar assembly protein FliW [Treponema sp.]|jgi:flagellar assembly factor FliW|nr:flagellar assembly protein FliW [Treponema sp.]